MTRPVLKRRPSPIPQNGTSLDDELNGLVTQATRALRCGLNKIIEPGIDEELQNTIRIEIYILASARRTARILLEKRASDERRTVANKLTAFYANWIADGALRWLGDPAELDYVHFSPHQH